MITFENAVYIYTGYIFQKYDLYYFLQVCHFFQILKCLYQRFLKKNHESLSYILKNFITMFSML